MTSAGLSTALPGARAEAGGMARFAAIGTGLLRKLPPNFAHRCAIEALKYRLLPLGAPPAPEILRSRLWDLDFTNPVGMSAGFDKNAEAVGGLFDTGFGFVETGTVTPVAQAGNPKPNLFRLEQDEALINRLGFPSQGLDRFERNLRAGAPKAPGPVGVNIGMNSNAPDPVGDIAICARRLAPLADYLVVNVSCPNTPGLADWQTPEGVGRMIAAAVAAREESGATLPVLVKFSPDIAEGKLEAVVAAARDAGVDGFISTNTTTARPASLRSSTAQEWGGLSGPPLAEASMAQLKALYRLTGGEMPLIACGGIRDAADAYARIRAGASLVQIYTALVYAGPGLVAEINRDLATLLQNDGFKSISDAVGVDNG